MKRAKKFPALILTMTFVASASSVTPIRGVDVIVQKNPGKGAAHVQTDGEGGFTVAEMEILTSKGWTVVHLEGGWYDIRLGCSKCAFTVGGNALVQVTIAGTGNAPLKKNMSKEELVSSVVFHVEVTAKQISGKVTQYR
jgi:hypothetical protein